MKMRFRRKKLLDQINEGLESLESLGLKTGSVTHTLISREDVPVLTKEIRSVGNGAYVMRTRTKDDRGNPVVTDLTFTVTKDTFTSSEGYSVDVLESLASLLEAVKRYAKDRP